MTNQQARQDLRRYADAWRFVSARFLASLAAQIMIVAVGWQMYARTGDPLDLGLIGLSQFIPFIALILPAGHVADHHDRSRIVSLCYVVQAVSALALLVMTLRDTAETWPVFCVMMALGAARAFSMPASQSLLPNIVPPEFFSRAVAMNSSAMQLAGVIGPALGGLIYLAGPQVVYLCVLVLVIIAAILMGNIGRTRVKDATREPMNWQTLLSGLQFVRSRPLILGAISLDLFAVLFGGATALLPMFASDILNVGPAGLGLLRTAPGVGAAVCAILITVRPMTSHVGAWMYGGVGVFGVMTLVFGLSTNFYVSLAALTVLGAADMVSVYVRHLLVQLETPDYIRGRVSAVSSVFIGASNELGDFESGVMAKWWGGVRAVLIGGVATLMVTGLWIKLFPGLWQMQSFPQRK